MRKTPGRLFVLDVTFVALLAQMTLVAAQSTMRDPEPWGGSVLFRFSAKPASILPALDAAEEWGKKMRIVVTDDAVAALGRSMNSSYAGTPDPFGLLSMFPVVHIIVVPAKPRNYAIWINGARYPSTEESRYAIPRGSKFDLRIEDGNALGCKWSKVVMDDETVTCKLESTKTE